MEFLCIANGATLHFVLASFALFHHQTSAKSPLLPVRLLAMHPLKENNFREAVLIQANTRQSWL